ncbi:hypothetical protein BH10BDE1_BH10BDE1_05770 [soil metagenome]
MRGTLLLLIGTLVFVVLGCGILPGGKPDLGRLNTPTVSGDPCRSADWFEVGRVDGIGGIPLGTSSYVGRCRSAGVEVNNELYTAGWERGLIDYCTPDRAYDAGRTGQAYSGVCPKNLEGEFLKRFRVGARIATIEKKNTQIELEVQRKLNELTTLDSTGNPATILSDALSRMPGSTTPRPADSKEARFATLQAEVERLRETIAQNEQAIHQLETPTSL